MSSPSQGENDNLRAEATVFGPSRLSLLRPVLLLALAWGALLLVLSYTDGTVAGRVASALMLLALSLAGARAVLRLWTVSVTFQPHGVVLRRGFPHLQPVAVAWHGIADAEVSTSGIWSGQTLRVEAADGRSVIVHDLAEAEEAASLIHARIGRFRGVTALLDGLAALERAGRR